MDTSFSYEEFTRINSLIKAITKRLKSPPKYDPMKFETEDGGYLIGQLYDVNDDLSVYVFTSDYEKNYEKIGGFYFKSKNLGRIVAIREKKINWRNRPVLAHELSHFLDDIDGIDMSFTMSASNPTMTTDLYSEYINDPLEQKAFFWQGVIDMAYCPVYKVFSILGLVNDNMWEFFRETYFPSMEGTSAKYINEDNMNAHELRMCALRKTKLRR